MQNGLLIFPSAQSVSLCNSVFRSWSALQRLLMMSGGKLVVRQTWKWRNRWLLCFHVWSWVWLLCPWLTLDFVTVKSFSSDFCLWTLVKKHHISSDTMSFQTLIIIAFQSTDIHSSYCISILVKLLVFCLKNPKIVRARCNMRNAFGLNTAKYCHIWRRRSWWIAHTQKTGILEGAYFGRSNGRKHLCRVATTLATYSPSANSKYP